eukprot:4534513-Lingulodinium_polyedra.AAC.1
MGDPLDVSPKLLRLRPPSPRLRCCRRGNRPRPRSPGRSLTPRSRHIHAKRRAHTARGCRGPCGHHDPGSPR